MSLVLKAHNIKGVINLFEQRKTSRFDELSASERPSMIILETP